ncbi:MAG: DegT/DnrJ/EryC1/StrS family aminotransferase [Bryobacteraceae bacterium]|nr:DegT/DnrJ/EryC1/StrS family aminotransferase [Bryobacteraceae bacterium]
MIPYSDLKPQHDALREELRHAIDEVLDSRQFILGKFVTAFEEEFAAYCGVRHAIAVNSGTSALHLALLAAGVGPGDEVVTVPFTFAATVAAVYYCGARPVFVDIDPRTFTMDVTQLQAAIGPRTKAILPVHLYGQVAPGMDEVVTIARQSGIAVIEDAAQAHGAGMHGRRAGSLGDMGCFSFYPTKNMGACGEGGLVTTDDEELARSLRLLRDWGQDRKYHHAIRGYNYRMEGLQGAVLSVKLRYVEQWTEARRAIAARYDEMLIGSAVMLPLAAQGMRHVYHTYTVRTEARDALQKHLADAGIGTAIHYPIPLHLQPAYADEAWPKGSLPESERAANQVLSLPVYAELQSAHLEAVAAAVRAFGN